MSINPSRSSTDYGRFLLPAYALSGFIGLGYQVFWFRFFVDQFGANNLTFTLVVSNFIGGLGVGSWFSRELSERGAKTFRISSPLRLYGLLELILALLMFLTLLLGCLPADLFGSFPYRLHNGIYYPTWELRAFQSLAASASIFLPCVVMGTTFPFLCRTFSAVPRFPSSLYAWNTLGACASVIICEFILIPYIGHQAMFAVIWILNLTLAVYFLRIPGSEVQTKSAKKAPPPVANGNGKLSEVTLLLAAALGGLAAGTLEAGMHQIISFVGYQYAIAMSFTTFWAILAIFLGGWTVHAVKKLSLAWIQAAFGLAAIIYLFIRFEFNPISEACRQLHEGYLARVLAEGTQPSAAMNAFMGMGSLWIFVGIVVFPTCYLVSLLLPYVCNAAQSRGLGVERHYALNTIAFCAGMLLFSRLVPRVNVFYSIKLHAGFFALLAVLVLLLRRDRPTEKWKFIAAGVGALLLFLLTSRGFDRDFFAVGSPARLAPITALKSNGAHTTFVARQPDSKSLYFESHSMSATSLGDQIYMRLMAHFPMLAHPHPSSALLICFGVGNTASAIAAHSSVEKIDIVDLNDKVIQTAPEFAETNFKVYEDPRVTFINDDGRHFLDLTDRTYDLITSEPPPPMHAGVYRLYSKEYYRSVLEHLTPHGIMTQWLPLNQISGPATDLMVSAFNQSFPHTLLFIGRYDHLILVGSRTPLDLARMQQRFPEDPKVVEDLAKRCQIQAPESLLARIVQSDSMLDARFGSSSALTDTGAELSQYAYAGYAPFFEYDTAKLANDLFASEPALEGAFRARTGNLEFLKSAVPDFPFKNLKLPH